LAKGLIRIVLDILKPHEPTLPHFAKFLSEVSGVEGVNVTLMEIDKETENIKVKGVYLVAAWDYLLPDLKKEHKTFFETGFDYETIKKTKIPITIIQSTNDPYLDFDKAKILAKKIGAKFIPVKNAGHFMERNGYKQFPLLQKLVLS